MTSIIGHEAVPPSLEHKARIGWWLFLAQFITVVVVYLTGSLLPVLPGIIEQVMSGETGEPEFGSALVASTVMLSMALSLLVCWLWLRREGRVAEAWNLTAPEDWRRTLMLAAVATVGTIAIFIGGGALVEAIGLPAPDASFVLDLVTESPLLFALWIVGVAILAAGVGEELLWRGFLMDRLERLGGLRGKIWLVLVVQAVLFGLPHAYQGVGGMIVTGSVGLLLGWVRILQRGNLWAVIIAHASVDVIMMSLAYADKLGWFGV
ncbi:CPBP family intramembrane glutamic endopeptidase [Erythrobacter alti]|uniref:CPBP family intramembrane glutamic endopeptidase n=1 Tax=Erythrobacter alti TaxID=1896145 RepID=UPI0030F4A197